jgi:hypothetical protein
MALYTYTLHLVRERRQGSLLSDLERCEGLVLSGKESRVLLGRAPFFVGEAENHSLPSCPLSVVTLELDDAAFEALLRQDPASFTEWIWRVAAQVDIAYAFIPGGGDIEYREGDRLTSEVTFERLGHLIATGSVDVVHPLMFFAERLGAGATGKTAEKACWPVTRIKPGIGCLLVLASEDPSTGALEILEPGDIYDRLRAGFAAF